MKKRLLSMLLVLCMVLPLLPLPANALNKSIVYPRTKLKDVYVNGFPYQYAPTGNWVIPKNNVLFTDKNGNVGLFSYKNGNKPRTYILDKDYNVLSDAVINLPSHDYFGTFAVAADGDYYVVVGHKNTEENAGKTVVSLLKAATVIDAGKVLNPKTARGLITGGMCMGLGLGSHESFLYDPEGKVLTTSLRTYKVMHIGEEPEYIVDFIETPQIDAPYGARQFRLL